MYIYVFHVTPITISQVRGCIFVASSPHILTYVDKQVRITLILLYIYLLILEMLLNFDISIIFFLQGKFTNQTLSGTQRLSETYNEDAPLSKQFINDQKHFGEHNRVADWVNNYTKKVHNLSILMPVFFYCILKKAPC